MLLLQHAEGAQKKGIPPYDAYLAAERPETFWNKGAAESEKLTERRTVV